MKLGILICEQRAAQTLAGLLSSGLEAFWSSLTLSDCRVIEKPTDSAGGAGFAQTGPRSNYCQGSALTGLSCSDMIQSRGEGT